MDIKEYISSGILERYVMGATNAQERQEVECMSHIYPEISAELRELQQSIENFTKGLAIEPPKALKSRILDAIENIDQESPLKAVPPKTQVEKKPKAVEKDETPVRFINNTNFWRSAAAACFLLLLGVGYLMKKTNSSLTFVQQQLVALNDDTDQLEEENQGLREQLTDLNQLKVESETISYLLAHHATKKVEMAGTKNSPESQVRVYWNTVTADVLLKVDDLPEVPKGKQYQLWAIADGTPLDMGVFEIDSKKTDVQIMPSGCEALAQAFAITLEEEGGVESPTLSAMYVLGNV